MIVALLLSTPAAAQPAPAEQPAEAEAGAETETQEETPQRSPEEQRFLELMGEAQSRFQASEYNAAIELWTQANVEIPPNYVERFRPRLLKSLADAHMRAYEGDGDTVHASKAKTLYESYLSLIEAEPETRAVIEQHIAKARSILAEEIRARREQEEREQRAAEEALKEHERARLRREAERKDAEEAEAAAKTKRALYISGAVSTTLGAGLVGVMGGFLRRGLIVEREGVLNADSWANEDDPDRRDMLESEIQSLRVQGERANQIALGAGIAGGVLLVTGISLIVVGATRRNRTTITPTASLTGAGLSARVDF